MSAALAPSKGVWWWVRWPLHAIVTLLATAIGLAVASRAFRLLGQVPGRPAPLLVAEVHARHAKRAGRDREDYEDAEHQRWRQEVAHLHRGGPKASESQSTLGKDLLRG